MILYVCDVVVAEALTGGDTLQRATIESLIRALDYLSVDPSGGGRLGGRHSRRHRRATGPRSLGDAIIAGVAWFNDATS